MTVLSIKPSTLILAVVTAGVVTVAFLGWLWSPDRQIRKHQENLISAAEKRNTALVSKFLSAEYEDSWSNSPDETIALLGAILRSFFALTIQENRVRYKIEGNRGQVISHLNLEGNGTAFAEVVIRETRALPNPFSFFWRRESWKPWDWKLVTVENPSIQVDRNHRLW